MAGTRASRATPKRDATPTRSSLRQRKKKTAKSAEVLGTVDEEVVAVDDEDIDLPAPPVTVRVRKPIGEAIGNAAAANPPKDVGTTTTVAVATVKT
jgi:hypothetical protein